MSVPNPRFLYDASAEQSVLDVEALPGEATMLSCTRVELKGEEVA